MKIIKPSVELLWITPDPEFQIELAGRTCYKSEVNNAEKFCRKMVKSGHHAMIEHACASFRIITDRGITHEIVRHRLASYAQESTRYCNYSKEKFGNELTFIEPPGMTTAQYNHWKLTCQECEDGYLEMLLFGASPQIARSVLPNCLKTEIIMTANFREWRHFITLRSSKAAHPQIRPIAQAIWEDLMFHAESIFEGILHE
jgi:thymidylate synthase (FAD)